MVWTIISVVLFVFVFANLVTLHMQSEKNKQIFNATLACFEEIYESISDLEKHLNDLSQQVEDMQDEISDLQDEIEDDEHLDKISHKFKEDDDNGKDDI